MKLQIWRSVDLKGPDGKVVPWQEKKNRVWKEIQMTYSDFSDMATAIHAVDEAAVNVLQDAKKTGKKIKTSFPAYKSYYSDFQ